MRKIAFYIVDVFAESRYAGNQLAVFRDADCLTSEEMQQIARELNYSETTFIMEHPSREGGFEVRIFTPEREVPFAGHPTLGTAYIIRQMVTRDDASSLKLHMKAGTIPVWFSPAGPSQILWMRQLPPVFGNIGERKVISAMLHLDEADLDPDYPVQEVSTGLPFFIVPVKSLEAVKRAYVDVKSLKEWVKDYDAKAILIFTPETEKPDHQLHVRVFVDELGIPEDPATGSANGCLAGYLVRHRYFQTPWIDLQVEQGYEIGRPSLLYIKAEENRDSIQISVGGKVHLVARGEWV